MWATFLNIFKDSAKPIAQTTSSNSTTLNANLNASSYRQEPPPSVKVRLWEHQKAMLNRLRQIEGNPRTAVNQVLFAQRYMKSENVPQNQQVPLGIMNDPPGSGKTYAILSLIAMDTTPTFNIIVVPQNIYSQWINALRTIFPEDSGVAWQDCTSYAALTAVMMDPMHFKNCRILLTTELYADTLANSLNTAITRVHRLILDEVDNIQQRMLNPIHAQRVWFLSASFDPKRHTSIGTFTLNPDDIPYMVCKTDQAFISHAVQLAEPSSEIIECDDDDIRLFDGIVPASVLTSMNGGYMGALHKYLQYSGQTYHQCAVFYKQKLSDSIPELQKELANIKQNIQKALAFNDGTEAPLISKAREIENELTTCQSSFNKLQQRLNVHVVDPSKENNKIWRFANVICERIKADANAKYLIFNDDEGALLQLETLLKERDISCVLLDGGNASAIDKAIAKYKNGDAAVLLLNSLMQGCGLNLENTTHLMFTHATNPLLVEQIVGRAQRYGRTCQLHIIGMFNKNELEKVGAQLR